MSEARIRVRLQPGSKRRGVLGWEGDVLRVQVHAPPVEGRANRELEELLAELLGLPRSGVRVVRGWNSREKLVGIEGVDGGEVQRRLADAVK